jgi:hypothetical protein
MMEAVCTSETSVYLNETTGRNITESYHFQQCLILNFHKDAIRIFGGNNRNQGYKKTVHHMTDKFKELGCNMRLELIF